MRPLVLPLLAVSRIRRFEMPAAIRSAWRTQWPVAVLVGLSAFLVRFLWFRGFSNDHFMHLAWARQVMHGDMPVRDFIDPGMPLMYYLSAGVQTVFGSGLLPEAVLTVGLQAVASGLLYWLAFAVSGSARIAAVVTLLQFSLQSRLYSYPKLFVYAAAIVLFRAYAARAGRKPWRFILAGVVVIAFLFRHDHGLFVAFGAAILIVTVHRLESRRVLLQNMLAVAAYVVLMLTPFLVYLGTSGGVVRYFEAGMEFSRKEAALTRLRGWPGFTTSGALPLFMVVKEPVPENPTIRVRWTPGTSPVDRAIVEEQRRLVAIDRDEGRTWIYRLNDVSRANVSALVRDSHVEDTQGIDRRKYRITAGTSGVWSDLERSIWLLRIRPGPAWDVILSRQNAVVWLYYLLNLLPLAVLFRLRAVLPRQDERTATLPLAHVAPVVVLLIAVNLGFLRDSLLARIADVGAPSAVLAAWLAGSWFAVRSNLRRRIVTAAVLIPTFASILILSDIREVIAGTVRLAARGGLTERATRVIHELSNNAPRQWPNEGVEPLVRYLQSCTGPADRLLVTWFAPELPVLARRPFAGPLPFYIPGFFSAPEYQSDTVRRLEQERVPIVLAEVSQYDDFAAGFPLIARYVEARYETVGEFDVGRETTIRVLANRARAAALTDPVSGLPCFSQGPATSPKVTRVEP